MLRYWIEKACSVACGISVVKVKISELKAIYLFRCNLQTAWHTLEKEGIITDGGKVEEKGSNASIQSFIHFFFPFQLPTTPKHVGDVLVLKAMAHSFI